MEKVVAKTERPDIYVVEVEIQGVSYQAFKWIPEPSEPIQYKPISPV
jgi:hypothetical protein